MIAATDLPEGFPMRLIVLALAILLPGAAFANCSTAKLQICTVKGSPDQSAVEAPCGVAQCATADAVFDYVGFGDSLYLRVDTTGEAQGVMNGNLGDLTDPANETVFEAFPVTMAGDYAYANGNWTILSTAPCDNRCDGLDADAMLD
jgi:hypothetical protein